MTIKVNYSHFKAAEERDPAELKRLLARDASWGTHIEVLKAAELTCGEEAHARWAETEPTITNAPNGRSDDPDFSLSFPDGNFNFETESVDHFVGVVAGDILLNPNLETIEVSGFEFTDASLYEFFPGPNVGIDGLYNDLLKGTLGETKRPILAFTLKPRLGMYVSEVVKIYEAAAKSGVDVVEDDERLIDPISCPFEERVRALAERQDYWKTRYSVNITSDSQSALNKLDFCAENGIRMVKLDVLVSGFETLRKVATRIRDKYDSRIAITVYPDTVGAYRKLGREFILQLSRLCGADVIYAGSPNWARYQRETGELRETVEPVYQRHRRLAEPIAHAQHIKSTLATITNDQHPSRAELLTTYLRKRKNGHFRYAFFVGGGISGFPADIGTATKVWIDLLNHAASQNLDDYAQYDLSRYEEDLERIGWRAFEVRQSLT